ncbi:OmpA family protein [Pikeienuella sp. HZG-20]|uniref:OmpA family protein n=1 Tax=Paludibacillus litoralis TaxID=3133267 RepID=UPI0030EE913C
MMKISHTVLAGFALVAAGCTNIPGANLGGTFGAEDFLAQDMPGGDFNAELAKQYQSLAAYNASQEVNWMDAAGYMDRSNAAAAGGVTPWDPSALGIGGEAAAMHSEVSANIAANSATNPAACAEAQALWDQWLEAQYQAPGGCLDADEVKAKFDSAYAACIGVSPANYIVYFGFDRSNLTAAAQGVVSDVVAALSGVANPIVSLVGHTDTSGPASYNVGLSQRRVNTVAQALASAGIPQGGVTRAARGESEPAVQTGDGVREPRNRRVEITIGN